MYYQFVIYNGYLAGMVNQFYFEVVGVGFYILLSIIILSIIVAGVTLTKGIKKLIKHYNNIRNNC